MRREMPMVRVGLLGVEPYLESKVARLRPEAVLVTLHAGDAAILHQLQLDVVIVSLDHPSAGDVLRGSGEVPALVVTQPDELPPLGALAITRPVSSPQLQSALDRAFDVPLVLRLLRVLAVEQDDHDIVQRYAFGIRALATLFSIAWVGLSLTIMPTWTLWLLAVYAVVRSLWWRLTLPALAVDIAVVAPIAFVGVQVTGSTPVITVILPVLIWIQTGYQLGLWRGIGVLSGTTVVVGLGGYIAYGSDLATAGMASTPLAMAVLGIATGAMIRRIVRSELPRRRQDLEHFRAALYDLSERQAVVALSFDLGTAAEEVLARVLRQTGPTAAVVLVAEPASTLKVAAAHNLTRPPPTRLTWSPSTLPVDEAADEGPGAPIEQVGGTGDVGGTSRAAIVNASPSHQVDSAVAQLDPYLPAGRRLALPAVVDGELLGGIVLVDANTHLATADMDEVATEAALAFDSVRLFNRLRAFTLDQERARIGRSLHDGVMQTLSHVGMQLDLAVRDDEVVADAAALRTLREHVLATVAEMRAVVNDLRSVRLDRGLQAALETMAVTVAPAGGPLITVHCDPAVRVGPQVEEQFLRITQEAVSNAVRHAQATRIDVALQADGDVVTLRIADDGIGFEASQAIDHDSGGVGMTSISQRATAIGAQLDVDTGPGTTILVTLRP